LPILSAGHLSTACVSCADQAVEVVLRASGKPKGAGIGTQPDLTLRAVQSELAERGVRVSLKAIWNFFRAERLTFKKSLHAAEQDRPDVARGRAQWKKYQARIDPKRLVFIDET
jgi:transposase